MPNPNLDITNLQAVAFDWDNTLAMTREILVKSINEILPLYNLPEWSIVCQQRDPQLSFKDNFPLIFGKDYQEAYEKYSKIYRQNTLKMLKKPDFAEETVLFFRKCNIKTLIVSNKDRKLLEFELPLLYKKEWFDNIVCGHEALKDKPNPEQLLFAVKNFVSEVNRHSVWMIGDSLMDSCCAVSAGAKAIRIGKPIWNDIEDNTNENTLFFDDFAQFYRELI